VQRAQEWLDVDVVVRKNFTFDPLWGVLQSSFAVGEHPETLKTEPSGERSGGRRGRHIGSQFGEVDVLKEPGFQ
jgi:hypothetical protein